MNESFLIRTILITTALFFLGLMIALPVVVVFTEAFWSGWDTYIESFYDPFTQEAIILTLKVALVSVPLNVLFGIAAAWTLTKFHFRGKQFLMTLIDLPFSVSPVIAGLVFILLYGSYSWLGKWLDNKGIDIIFAFPGLVLATTFVTLPYVARELISLMQEQGTEEEEAALLLGASGFTTFLKVTLPNIKWALIYGILICNARAMGEFGAVSVVSGFIKGETITIPLQVEMLYNEYHFVSTFAVSTILTLLAFLTLFVKWSLHERDR